MTIVKLCVIWFLTHVRYRNHEQKIMSQKLDNTQHSSFLGYRKYAG
jgi:hypothetical protein